jgi:hypothetical protein
MKTEWTQQRVERLFERYNRIYWRGKLSGYRVVLADLSKESAWGLCEWRKKIIKINPHRESDREVRATLLHEMAHAASRSGHTVPFFAQLERLIKRGAVVKVDAAEAGQARILADIVPKRFPLVRAKMQRAENRRARRIVVWEKAHPNVQAEIMTNDRIVQEFEEVEACALTWKRALVIIGLQYGLTDESGRPVNARARSLVQRARKAHRRARREHLQYEKRWHGIMVGS